MTSQGAHFSWLPLSTHHSNKLAFSKRQITAFIQAVCDTCWITDRDLKRLSGSQTSGDERGVDDARMQKLDVVASHKPVHQYTLSHKPVHQYTYVSTLFDTATIYTLLAP